MKKNKLLIDYEFDFELLGVSSAARGYKLAWELNQTLGINLIKQPDLVVGFKKELEKTFSYYSFETALNRLKLFKNRPHEQDEGKYFLIPEFPHYDFIILAAMNEKHTEHNLIDLIKSVPSIQFVAPISLEGLKSRSNFIF
ncbi:MAG TPA: IPExxxVDY family protein [Chryseosolibacter sp.]|nr:IPExxxVDY family protein [Chryseosolibacter sp.]